jgi:hypothetical protein
VACARGLILLLTALLLASIGCSSAANHASGAGSGEDGGAGGRGGPGGPGNPGGGPSGGGVLPDGGIAPSPDACVPLTCPAVAANCGTIEDGCGGTLTCGTCGSGDTCGGGGTANVCGPGTCNPTSCALAGKNCGQMSDGCSATLQCGSCTTGETCGGGGKANVCGTGSCTPTTCAAMGKNCGSISDGCSGTLLCGTCTSPEVCGIGAKSNVCAVPCAEGCPTGFSCDADGECAGGSASGIDLNLQTVTVSGTVTLNGAAPVANSYCGSSYPLVNVSLTETTYGYSFTASAPCTGNTWSLSVYPGTYKVYVEGGGGSNAPETWYVANPSLALTSSQSNIALDLKTITASGTVTLNGVAPVANSYCGSSYPLANVNFTEVTYGYSFTTSPPCTSNAWTVALYPGTYKVEIEGGGGSNAPETWYVANPSLALTSSQSNIALDVKTVTASGTVTLNGVAPVANSYCGSSYPLANVNFTEVTYGYSFTTSPPCTSNAWTVALYPGTYKVEVEGGGGSNMPETWYVANTGLVVTTGQSNIALDLPTVTASGTVTLNGVAPVANSYCGSSYPLVNVSFTETTHGYTFTTTAPCTSNAWTLPIYPGTYKVYVEGGGGSNAPETWYVANPALALTATQSNIALDLETVTASGTVTLNGVAPVANSYCGSSYPLVNVNFTEVTYGYSFTTTAPCTSNAWTVALYPGTYKVEVEGGGGSDAPESWYVVNAGLAVTSAQSGLAFDLKTATVGGVVTLNGVAPVANSYCGSSYPLVNVNLTEVSYGYSFTSTVPCTSDAWTATVYPGVYRVDVEGGGGSNMPETWEVIVDRIALP